MRRLLVRVIPPIVRIAPPLVIMVGSQLLFAPDSGERVVTEMKKVVVVTGANRYVVYTELCADGSGVANACYVMIEAMGEHRSACLITLHGESLDWSYPWLSSPLYDLGWTLLCLSHGAVITHTHRIQGPA